MYQVQGARSTNVEPPEADDNGDVPTADGDVAETSGVRVKEELDEEDIDWSGSPIIDQEPPKNISREQGFHLSSRI